MEQGSTLDSKSGHDFADGDWSERTEPRGEWCSQHGYYGPCPECGGVTPPVEIPAEAAPLAFPFLDFVATNTTEARGNALEAIARAAPALDHVPIGTNPGLLARVRLALGR